LITSTVPDARSKVANPDWLKAVRFTRSGYVEEVLRPGSSTIAHHLSHNAQPLSGKTTATYEHNTV
jgi:hypothetical protein